MRYNSELAVWQWFTAFKESTVKLKQEDPFPQYVGSIAETTSEYEQRIRILWLSFKAAPTRENAKRLAKEMVRTAEEYWPEAILAVLGLDLLTRRQQRILEDELEKHTDYIMNSLLPDIFRVFDEGGVLDSESFSFLDHRVVFMYAGALWSLGFLMSVTFDGTDERDLADLFLFLGPNDEATCKGERGCEQYAGKVFTLAQIIADDIIPGHLQCLTNCRHILIPIASPLAETKKGGAGSGFHGHSGRPGKRGGSAPARISGEMAALVIGGKSGARWQEDQDRLTDQLKQRVMLEYDAADRPSEVDRKQLEKWIDRLGEHRTLILDEAMKVAEKRLGRMPADEQEQLMTNLVKHDADKYSFAVAEAYIGSFSIDRKTYEGAFTAALTSHHENNPHHWEHWVSSESIGGKTRRMAQAIPRVHFIEMMGDWNGTAREKGMPKDAYYSKYRKSHILHPDTRNAVEREYGWRKYKELVAITKGGVGSGHHGHVGVPGKRGGSAISVGFGEAAKRGLPAGDYESVWSGGNTNGAKAALKRLGAGHVMVRVNGKYHVVRTEVAPTSPAAKSGGPKGGVHGHETAEHYYEKADSYTQRLARRTGVIAVGDVARQYVEEQVLPATRTAGTYRDAASPDAHSPDQMIALVSPPQKERREVLKKYLGSWDRENHSSFKGQVNGIFKVVHNEHTLRKWDNITAKQDNTRTGLYHGTHASAAASIAANGYRVGKAKTGRMMGAGLYLAESSSKTVQYVGTSMGRRSTSRGVVFENTVSLGKTAYPELGSYTFNDKYKYLTRNNEIKASYDSIYAKKGDTTFSWKPLVNSELVVKKPQAALPVYWMDVTRGPA